MNMEGKVCMNKLSTELTCAGLELTILGLCSLQEGKGKKVNDNLAETVIFFTSHKEMRVFIPEHYTTTKEDVHEHIRRIIKWLCA